jgi:hypothetical protein
VAVTAPAANVIDSFTVFPYAECGVIN